MKISDEQATELNRRVWEAEEGLDGIEVVNVILDLLDDREELLRQLSEFRRALGLSEIRNQKLERVVNAAEQYVERRGGTQFPMAGDPLHVREAWQKLCHALDEENIEPAAER